MIMTPSEWRELVDEAARDGGARERLVELIVSLENAVDEDKFQEALASSSKDASNAQSNNTSDSERK